MRRLVAALSLASVAFAQSDDSVNARIRKESAERSEIMRTLHMLTDRYGPRA
jgi:carboxypeptidase Q